MGYPDNFSDRAFDAMYGEFDADRALEEAINEMPIAIERAYDLAEAMATCVAEASQAQPSLKGMFWASIGDNAMDDLFAMTKRHVDRYDADAQAVHDYMVSQRPFLKMMEG